jgi:hypothetical protein
LAVRCSHFFFSAIQKIFHRAEAKDSKREREGCGSWPAKFGSEMGVKKPLVELMRFGSGETTRQSWNGPQQLFNVIFLTVSTGGDQLLDGAKKFRQK